MRQPSGRSYRIGTTAAASVVARVTTSCVSLISVPLILHEVGPEQFGLWSTVTSAIALLNLADLGIGNSLLNAVATRRATEAEESTTVLVSTAAFLFVAISGVLFIALVTLTLGVDWARVFGVAGTDAARQATPTFFIVGLAFVLALPASVTSKVQLAYQEGYVTQSWIVGGQFTALAALLVAVAQHASLPVIAACGLLAPVIIQVACSVDMFAHRHRELRPRLRMFDRQVARRLMTGGLLFMFLQMSWTIAFASDNLIIDRLLGPAAVAGYAVPYRAFTAVAALAVIPLTALWPAFTDAAARHDWHWLRQSVARAIGAMTALGLTLAILAMVLGRPLLSAWIGRGFVIGAPLLLAFSIWILLFCVGNALGLYFNALGVLRFQLVAVATMVVANVWLSIVLVRAWGVSGAIYASVITYAALVAAPYAWYIRRHLRTMSANMPPPLAQAIALASSAIASSPSP